MAAQVISQYGPRAEKAEILKLKASVLRAVSGPVLASSSIERLTPRRLGQANRVALRVASKHLLQLGEAVRAAVADRRAQMLQHVVDDRPHRSARGHADLEPFGAERFDFAGVGVLEIEAIADCAAAMPCRETP